MYWKLVGIKFLEGSIVNKQLLRNNEMVFATLRDCKNIKGLKRSYTGCMSHATVCNFLHKLV